MTQQNNWKPEFYKKFADVATIALIVLGDKNRDFADEIMKRRDEFEAFIRSVEEKAREEESLKWGERVSQLEGKIKNLRAEQELLSSVDKSLL